MEFWSSEKYYLTSDIDFVFSQTNSSAFWEIYFLSFWESDEGFRTLQTKGDEY